MRRPAAILFSAVAALASLPFGASCHPKAHLPGWVQAAPGDSLAAFSGEAGWMLSHKDIQAFIARDPMVERALDLFLQKAHINPRAETGRITFHVLGVPQKGEATLQKGLEQVLIQLNQFKDPAALVGALAESFPQEGSLRIQDRDWPLYVILDVETGGTKAHIRAASDEQGQVWIGSLDALSRLASKKGLGANADAALAAEWISPRAPFQGYLRPEALLGSLRQNLEGSIVKDLPQGVHALFWSITPAEEKDQPVRFELALAGTPEGINQVAPWLQRLVAAANAVQPSPGAAPELLQEKRRVGLRCTLTVEQLKQVMEKLGQPGFPFGVPNKTPTGPREGRRASEARNASRSVAGTTRDERDAASRRPPALARRDEARQAPRGVRALEQRTTLPCGPFPLGIASGDTRDKLISAVHPAWLHRGLVGVLLRPLMDGRPPRQHLDHFGFPVQPPVQPRFRVSEALRRQAPEGQGMAGFAAFQFHQEGQPGGRAQLWMRGPGPFQQPQPLAAAGLDEGRDEQPVQQPFGGELMEGLGVGVSLVRTQAPTESLEGFQHPPVVIQLLLGEPCQQHRSPGLIRERLTEVQGIEGGLLLIVGMVR